MNPAKVSGPYSIPVKLIKIVKSPVSEPLSNIINDSFITGVFPGKLKISRVNPLHKKESSLDPNNYRPVSLLSIFSKIYEKVMYTRLYKFLENSNLFYSKQFGFRSKHSTNHALISISENIKNSIDNGKFGCGIFLDLKKAFDTVNHNILLDKMEYYGVRGNALKWFQSYLENSKQFVSVNGVSSEILDVKCGVPQDSVLGPLLFLIFINDLPEVSKKLKFYLFADDTNIYFESQNLNVIEKTVNAELRKVNRWLIINKLALSVEKSNFVLFHSASRVPSITIKIKIGNKRIAEEKYVKFLGVLVDSTLSWKPHVKELTKKLTKITGMFYKLRYFISISQSVMLYNALVFPLLLYGIVVWGNTYPSNLDSLLHIQNKFLKIINFCDQFDSPHPLFISSNILKVHDLHNAQLASFVYESTLGLNPVEFHNYFTDVSEIHQHLTRQSDVGNLYIPRRNTTQYGLFSISFAGASLWNTLSNDIRKSTSIYSFRKKMKEHYIYSYKEKENLPK